jgi:ankyrin repeat protein
MVSLTKLITWNSLNIENNNKYNALMYAIGNNHVKIAKLLFKKRSYITHTYFFMVVLSEVNRKINIKMIALLLKNGAYKNHYIKKVNGVATIYTNKDKRHYTSIYNNKIRIMIESTIFFVPFLKKKLPYKLSYDIIRESKSYI